MDSFGGRSRFSCLKIDDDTDSSGDDDRESESKGKAQQLSQKKVRGNQKEEKKASTGGLIVHPVVQKQKNKSKKKKKASAAAENDVTAQSESNESPAASVKNDVAPQAESDEILERKYQKGNKYTKFSELGKSHVELWAERFRNTYHVAQQFSLSKFLIEDRQLISEDLQTALELSREMAISAASPSQETSLEMATKSNKEKEQRGAESDNVELLTADVDKEASNLLTKTGGSTTSRERQLVALYRTKLLEVLRQQKLDNDIRKKAEEEMTKYRSRYKKLCQLLNDAEAKEKTDLILDLERARKLETELSTEIGKLRGELMQALSKVRELEAKNRELTSKH